MKEQKQHYKWLYFFLADYKAYELALNQLAEKGYELLDITRVGLGKFKKVEPASICYRVEIISKEDTIEQIKTYQKLGWMYVAKRDTLYIFKKVNEHKGPEEHKALTVLMEESFFRKEIFRKEGFVLLLTLLWGQQACFQLANLDYRDFLDNHNLFFPMMLLCMTFATLGISIRLVKLYFSVRSISKVTVHLSHARFRIGTYIGGLVFALLVYFFMNSGGGNAFTWQGIGIVLTTLIISFLTGRLCKKCHLRWQKGLVIVGGVLGVIITFQLTMMMILRDSDTRYEAQREENRLVAQQSEGVRLKNFTEGKGEKIEDEQLERQTSWAVPHYDAYNAHKGTTSLNYEFFECRNEYIAEYVAKGLLEKDRKRDNERNALQVLEHSPYVADEIYYNEERKRLLLRHQNKVLFLRVDEMNLWDTNNIHVINKMLLE